ncbi:MAG: IS630 family transposase [Pseudonocardiaceae bacterium]
MTRHDARSLPAAAQEEKRRTAIRLRTEGRTFAAIGDVLGVHWATVHGWWQRYQVGGLAALGAQRRGRRLGAQRTLTPRQERTVQRLVTDQTPDQLKMPFALWTRAAIGALIQQRYGVRMPVRTIGHYLKRWGFTPQKPLKRAYEQQPDVIQHWLTHEYPKIAARAKAERAEIHWGDETSLSTSDPRGRGFAPRGHTPVLSVVARRKSVSFLSTVTNQGKVRFMVLEGPLTAPILIRFLRRLIRDTKRRVFVILDNLNVHKAATVRAWVQAHRDAIALFYLPPYAPELNPDEYLNGDLKLGVAKRAPARTKPELSKAARSHLRMLQRRPERVRRFFEHPRIKYAA